MLAPSSSPTPLANTEVCRCEAAGLTIIILSDEPGRIDETPAYRRWYMGPGEHTLYVVGPSYAAGHLDLVVGP